MRLVSIRSADDFMFLVNQAYLGDWPNRKIIRLLEGLFSAFGSYDERQYNYMYFRKMKIEFPKFYLRYCNLDDLSSMLEFQVDFMQFVNEIFPIKGEADES